jgi:hypothetical protein
MCWFGSLVFLFFFFPLFSCLVIDGWVGGEKGREVTVHSHRWFRWSAPRCRRERVRSRLSLCWCPDMLGRWKRTRILALDAIAQLRREVLEEDQAL